MSEFVWVVHGYNYGPIAVECAAWVVVLALAAVLAWFISLFCGDAQELIRLGLTVLLMVVVTPVTVYSVADATGHWLPSQQSDHYWVDRAAYDKWHDGTG